MERARGRGQVRSILLVVAIALATAMTGPAAVADAGGTAVFESQLTALLQRHTQAVDEKVGTRVDYAVLSKDPDWAALLGSLAAIDPASLTLRDEKLAFWINAYNVFAIDLVATHWPIASIKDIGWVLRPVWKNDAGKIAGRAYSLDEIEHEILRKMGEPRIHGAIVCAAISCPNLRREAYTASRLDAQLADNMRAWLRRPEKGMRLDREARALRLSRIFDWFGDDFEGQGGVLAVVTRYAPDSDRAWLREQGSTVDLEYFDYDWRLNEWSRRGLTAPAP